MKVKKLYFKANPSDIIPNISHIYLENSKGIFQKRNYLCDIHIHKACSLSYYQKRQAKFKLKTSTNVTYHCQGRQNEQLFLHQSNINNY